MLKSPPAASWGFELLCECLFFDSVAVRATTNNNQRGRRLNDRHCDETASVTSLAVANYRIHVLR